jgi:excisionase family DNA binding protein
MRVKQWTTGEAAARVGITRATLQAWIAANKIQAPKAIVLGKVTVRMWSESDIQRLRRTKERIYRKGRGRKPNKVKVSRRMTEVHTDV